MREKGNVSLILFYRIPRNQTEELMSTVRETFPNREEERNSRGAESAGPSAGTSGPSPCRSGLCMTRRRGAHIMIWIHDAGTGRTRIQYNTVRRRSRADRCFAGWERTGTIPIVEPFPGFTRNIRQSWCCGDGGPCDLAGRLFELCEAAARHGNLSDSVKLVLSSHLSILRR